MTEKKVLPCIYEYASYPDVLKHVGEEMGEEGRTVVLNPDQPPVIWHQWAHLTWPELFDHTHQDFISGEAEEKFRGLMKQLKDGTIAKIINESLEDSERLEHYIQEQPNIDAVIEELSNKNTQE